GHANLSINSYLAMSRSFLSAFSFMRIIGILPTCASTCLHFKVLLEATLQLTWNEE
ncbi:7868_t:CDS:1, partial [Entrophospora sp. SA101]